MISIQTVEKKSWNQSTWHSCPDKVIVEEALLINLEHQGRRIPLALTMRTPGHDHQLAAGYLLTEGIIHDLGDIKSIESLKSCQEQEGLTILVSLCDDLILSDRTLQRYGRVTSACGMCGKTSMDQIRQPPKAQPASSKMSHDYFLQTLEKAKQHQDLFQQTGASHQACFFSLTGEVLGAAEDVGRHNALDKLIGSFLLQNQLPQLQQGILFLSGRCSFELIHKAAMVQIPMVVSVGAPSSMAIKKALDYRITLGGFLKNNSINFYTGWERLSIENTTKN